MSTPLSERKVETGSLVLYKNRPAWVVQSGEKLEIEVEGRQRLKVRPKDISLLHPGPVQSLDGLRTPAGETDTAWELLQGSTASLPELAELIYGTYTPATAWATWEQVAQGLYFRGTLEAITAVPSEEVQHTQDVRQARIRETQAWNDFVARLRAGQTQPEDARYLKEVEEVALGHRIESRVMRELGRAETPQNAHALLLEAGYWDITVDPYPARQELTISSPDAVLPELGDEERRDLTHLPAYAIDDEGSHDPDDAVSLELTSGGRRVWVHVADAAALVWPDSPADLEARARGANLYLPEGTVSMLPDRALEILGLGLNKVSPALSFGLEIDSQGGVVGVEIVPSRVRVERLTYEQAETRLEEEPFHSLYQIALAYQTRRHHNGAISVDLPETIVRVTDGEVMIRPVLPLRSRDMVREAMLMAGEAAADFALLHQIPFAFASQEASTPLSQAEKPAEAAILSQAVGTENLWEENLVQQYALRRGMKRGQVNTVPKPHAGLGLAAYARTTSPLRRYLDLVVHQQLRAFLSGTALLDEQALLERVGASEAITGTVSATESRARRHWTLVYLLRHPQWHGEGVLVEKYGGRGRVLVPELALEAQVHLRQDWRLGTRLPLRLTGVNLPDLEVYFQAG